MRAATRLKYEELVRQVEESLKKLGFVARKNQTNGVTEFEVVSPSRFRVLVEQGIKEEARYALLASEKNLCWVQVARDLEDSEPAGTASASASAFVVEFTSGLAEKPWNGFGVLRGRRERKRWAELGRL